jgi:hypothetical protein
MAYPAMSIVTTRHCCKRPPRKRAKAATTGCALVAVVAVCTLLAGCVADTRPSDQNLALHGYWYHDGNHQGGASAQASDPAINNATHGTWLWPPAESDAPPD